MKKYLLYIALVALTTAYMPALVGATQNNTAAHRIITPSKKVVHTAQVAIQATANVASAAKVQTPDILIPTDHEALMKTAGIDPADFSYVNYIVSHESGWCTTKWEGEIGYCPQQVVAVFSWQNPNKGYGLVQSTPAIKMSDAGLDWQTNPVTQLRWADAYAKARYGGWYNSYLHWTNPANHNW